MRRPEPNQSNGIDSVLGMSNFKLGLIGIAILVAIFVIFRLWRPSRPHLPAAYDQQFEENFITMAPAYNRHERLAEISPLDINTASYDDLRLLPRVTDTVASAIIAKRPFFDLEQLDDVYGIGPKTVDLLRPYIIVNQQSLHR
jgi:hypothetical protein